MTTLWQALGAMWVREVSGREVSGRELYPFSQEIAPGWHFVQKVANRHAAVYAAAPLHLLLRLRLQERGYGLARWLGFLVVEEGAEYRSGTWGFNPMRGIRHLLALCAQWDPCWVREHPVRAWWDLRPWRWG